MSIIVTRILKKISEKSLLVEANHYDEIINVSLVDNEDNTAKYLNHEITFEMDYEKIQGWKMVDNVTVWNSGLFSNNDESIIIRGEVHNLLVEEQYTIIDIYLGKGAEFLAIESADIDNYIPKVKDGIELIVEGLKIYPVHY